VSALVVLVALPVVSKATTKIEVVPLTVKQVNHLQESVGCREEQPRGAQTVECIYCSADYVLGRGGDSGAECNTALHPTGDSVV
jgi:hypothetical protein